VGVTVDALSGSSVDDLIAASSAAGVTAAAGVAFADDSRGNAVESGAPGTPAGVEGVDGTEDVGVAEGDDGLPGVPAFSGLFSLMTVRQAPSTRTNEYALIIRQHGKPGKPAHNCSHCCDSRHNPV
jgi:hypothetical protein